MFFRIWGLLNSAIVMYIYGPMCLHYFFCCDESFFVRGLFLNFVTRTVLTNILTKAKRKSLSDGAFMRGNGGRGSDLGVFLKTLIINSSAIIETSSELIQTRSELIRTRSELIRTRSELISTIAELISTIAEEI